MNDKQREIIKEWEKTKVIHPSFDEIAKKTGLSKSYCHITVKKYLATKKSLLRGK